jgi:hypothetical protein
MKETAEIEKCQKASGMMIIPGNETFPCFSTKNTTSLAVWRMNAR